jgi:hypothetical protein
MAAVVVRIALAVVSLAVAIALGYQLRAHDIIANGAELAAQPHPGEMDVLAQQIDLRGVAKDLRPGSQASLAEAALDLRTRDYRGAVQAATRATKREPKNFSAWVTLAVARGALGDAAGRREAFAKAHELNPLDPIPR